MLRISKLADYAILIMHCLAVSEERPLLSASDVADTVQLSLPTVKKILKMLSEAGLLLSVRGSEGGYGLAKEAQHIQLVQIIAAIEGELALTECANDSRSCTQNDSCAVKHNWQVIHQYIFLTLANISLADMMTPLFMSDIQQRNQLANGDAYGR
ncbi:MAG: putative HTH-type transcriptional regulator [Gammaproteobacteria bacterium]|jgi:FeS assembly SUF system regulator|nr:putative HTH-type transcriptional regulator [Gammaproteobacteria bacterium]